MENACEKLHYFCGSRLAGLEFWLLSANADPPAEQKIVDVREMSVKERAALGEQLIFGEVGGNKIRGAIGKVQCPLCHGFRKGFLSERAPNLDGITDRANERLKDPRYHLGKPNERDTVQRRHSPGLKLRPQRFNTSLNHLSAQAVMS